MSWHSTSYFDFTVLWDLLLSTVCGLHFFSYLEHAHSQHNNSSHNKFQMSLKQREGEEKWHKKTWLELLRTAPERAQMLLDTCILTPRTSNVELKIHFCWQCVHMCKLLLQTHWEHWRNILQDNCLSRLTYPGSLVLKVRQNASVNSSPPEQKVCPATADCHVW